MRADNRFTLLDFTKDPTKVAAASLAVDAAAMTGRWGVYAGLLPLLDCSGDTSLGCGDGHGVMVSSEFDDSSGLVREGFVLAVPRQDQTTGSFTVRMTNAFPDVPLPSPYAAARR